MIVILVVLLLGAGIAQLVVASRHHPRFQGPVSGTPLPSFPIPTP